MIGEDYMNDIWKDFIEKLPENWRFNPPLVEYSKIDLQSKQKQRAYRTGGGVRQRVRSKDPLQAGYYDISHYKTIIKKLSSYLPDNPLIVDLGCGDGRGVEILLELGVQRIIAVDFNERDLMLLLQEIEKAQKNVLPVLASVTDSPLFPESVDAVIMLEVAYTLEDPIEAYLNCNRWLKPGGYAVVSNVAIEAYYIHAILNNDWEQVRRIAEEKRYLDKVGGQEVLAHLYDAERMRKDAQSAGFKIIESEVVPATCSLLLHALRKSIQLGEDKIQLLEKVNKALINLPRIYIDILKKKD
jgi:SAM-dependent methyltransferase